MSKFNVGDRVEYIGANTEIFRDCKVKTGSVIHIGNGILVHFDDEKFHGHNATSVLDNLCDFKCWWCFEGEITLLKNEIVSTKDTNTHYSSSKIQPIEYIQSIFKDNKNLTPFESACIKDIIKYTGRYGKKDEKLKEAGKILDYALWLYLSANGIDINPRVHTHKEIMDKVVNQ